MFPSSRVRTGPLCDVPDSAMWADVPAAVGDEVVVTWWPADRRDEAERSDDMTVSWIPNPRRTYIEEIFPRSEAWTAEQYEREIERQVASATVRGGRLVGGIVVQSVHLHSDGNGAPGTSVQAAEPARWVLDVEDSSILHYVDPDGELEETLHQPAGMPGPVWDDVVEGLTRP